MIGHFIDAVVRHVADRNATSLGRIQVDVVHADAVSHDDLRLPHTGNDIGIHRGELSNDRIGIGHQLRQLGAQSASLSTQRLRDPADGECPPRYRGSETSSR